MNEDMTRAEIIAKLRKLPPPIIQGEMREPELQWKWREPDERLKVRDGVSGTGVRRGSDSGQQVLRDSRQGLPPL